MSLADPSNVQYVCALQRAIACTENARAGWLAVRTAALPAGDREGDGKAAFALSGFALELDRFEEAMRWLAVARKEVEPKHEDTVSQNLAYVLVHMDEGYETELQRVVLQVLQQLRRAAPPPAWQVMIRLSRYE